MKKLKGWKLAAFALMFVLMLVGTVRLIAWAGDTEEGFKPEQIEVDYVNETVTVRVVDRSVYPTVNLDQIDYMVYYTDKYNKDLSKWDACEVREREVKDADGKVTKEAVAVFDISWINDSKTVRLYLCGNQEKTKVVAVDIVWEENFSVDFTGTLLATDITEAEKWQDVYEDYPNFTEDTGYFLFYLEEEGREKYYMNLENIMWRKGDDGVWREFSELDLKEMNIRGVKLEFRIKADNGITDADGKTVSMARASSTAKHSVSKLSSAPQIVVNSDTMTLAIKNGMEFSFTWGPEKDDWIMVPEYSKKFGEYGKFVTLDERDEAYEKIYTDERVSELTIQEVLKAYFSDFEMNSPLDRKALEEKYGGKITLTDEGFILYVRKIGTEKDAASKITEVIIPYAADNMATPNKAALKIEYGESKTNTGGILITNVSDTKDGEPEAKYQIAVVSKEVYEAANGNVNEIDISDVKWTSIKPGKTTKIANKKAPAGSYLIYRIAGENGNLPSTYEVWGEIVEDALTYAGIAPESKNAGDILQAVVSTNIKEEKLSTLTYKWQVYDGNDVKNAKDDDWKPLADGATYTLKNEDAGKYVRVMITDTYGNIKYSDYVGPIKATETPADQNQNRQ